MKTKIGLLFCCFALCCVALVHAAPARRDLRATLLAAVQQSDLPKVRALLAKGANPNASVENGFTPLMAAVECQTGVSLPIVQALLAKGANVNAKTHDGRVALHAAVYTHSVPLIQALIRKGVNVNVPEEYGQTPLERSVAMGDVAIVKLLLDAGAKLRFNKNTSPMLMVAAGSGNVEIAKMLLARGAQVNEKYGDGTSLLAAANAGNVEMVKLLLSKGAIVDARDQGGNTALLSAAEMGHLEAAKVLIAAGANVNAKDREGSTPLSWAAISEMGQPDAPLLKFLLDHGADPNAGPEPPLYWAAKNGGSRAVQLLLDKGANPNAAGVGGTALLAVLQEGNSQRAQMMLYGFGGTMSEAQRNTVRQASERSDTEIVRALIAHGVDVTTGPNRAALILAALGGNVIIVQQLLDKGAPLNITDIEAPVADSPGDPSPQGMRPLMAAASNGHPEVVSLLLSKGSDANAKDRAGRTALMRVALAGRSQVVRMLPQMREAVLHRADEGSDKPISRAVSAKEKADWLKWAESGDTAVIQSLLAQNADVNARDAKGQTALMHAAANSTPAVVQALLQAKAEINAQDATGETALMHVVENGRRQHAPELFSYELQNSASITQRMAGHFKGPEAASAQKTAASAKAAFDRQKSAILQEATQADLAMLKMLVASGANLNTHDKKGRTALFIAAQKHFAALVTFLQKAGAPFTAPQLDSSAQTSARPRK